MRKRKILLGGMEVGEHVWHFLHGGGGGLSWGLYGGLEFPQIWKFLCRSVMGHVLRHVFGDGVGRELGLTFMEHKLFLNHSSGTFLLLRVEFYS